MIPMFFKVSPPVYDLDGKCPYCRRPHDIGEAFDGGIWPCRQCRRLIVFVESGTTVWACRYGIDRGAGRKRTRRLWRRRGRR